MLKESPDLNQLDKLHRERTRWVTATWVFGVLFALAVLGVFSLGLYIVKPELVKQQAGEEPQKEETKAASPAEEEGEAIPQVAGVSVDDDPVKGSPDAKVTIVEFSDFLCPFCAVSAGFRPDLQEKMKERDASWEAAVPKILENYVETGKARFVFRDFPVVHGEPAARAAEAAECAGDLGKYWEMHDLLFSRQENFPENETEIANFLKGLARELALDESKFSECFDSRKYQEEINKDIEAAKSYGVSGTPTYFVNGQKIIGAHGFSIFQEVIEEELVK